MNRAGALGAARTGGLLGSCSRRMRRAGLVTCSLPGHSRFLAFQVKQAELLLERLSTGLTAEKVLDKVTTVITGQTTVEPELLGKQLKAITEGEDYTWEDLRSGLVNDASNLWSTSYDLVSNFSPVEFGDWAGGLLSEFAERFAAWELSSLVALGERWLIWTPLVVLPMAWQMSQSSDQKQKTRREKSDPVEASVEKQERVRKELERLKWRSTLIQQVKDKASATSIEESIKRLQELCSVVLEDETTLEEIDGSWQLLYSSQQSSNLFPQLPGLLEVSKLEQKIRGQGTDPKHELSAQNSATIRLGNVGVIEVNVHGTWEQLTSVVSFDAFTARFVQVFGTPVAEDLPALTIPLPVPLRQSAQWKLLYLDDKVRVNQGNSGQFYIFLKSG